MEHNSTIKLFGWFYHCAFQNEYRKRLGKNSEVCDKVKNEYQQIMTRAKDIGHSKLLSAYCMAAYFIAVNRNTGLSPEENYEIFECGLYKSKLFHVALGKADSYLSTKKLAGRKEWSRQSYERKYENDWVVDILEGNEQYDLGYDYHECGVCKLCKDEGCFEFAKYLCKLDFVMADIMGMRLERTQTIAEGATYCDFRYSRK